MNLEALKHLNPEQAEVGVCLVQLPENVDGPESELFGDGELYWQERQSPLAVACN